MAYFENDGERAAAEIEAARAAVTEAQRNYSRGRGSCEAVVRADRRLADAHCSYRELVGGNVRVR